MSEAYDKAKQLLDQLVYSPPGAAADNGLAGQQQAIIAPQQRALFERLQSFTSTTWFGKPPSLSPVACAIKGWRNTGPDVLTCDSCGCKIWCKLPANPLSDSGIGIVRGFVQQLTAGHDAACPQRSSQAQAAASIRFPIVPNSRLSSSYSSRLRDLQRLESAPNLQAAALAKLAAAAQRLDPSLLKALAAVLQLPVAALQQWDSSAAAVGQQHGSSALLTKHQSAVLLALCGWQVQPLLPPHLAISAAAHPGSAFGVSHLLPRPRSSSSAGPSTTSSAAAAAAASGSISSSTISSAHAALECELCGAKVGLWRFSCSGPYYAAQLASKAMALVGSADAALAQAGASSPNAASAEATAAEGPTAAAAAAGCTTSTSIAGGPLHMPTPGSDPQQQQQEMEAAATPAPAPGEHEEAAAAAPDAVVNSLYHTIAGGSLLSPPGATSGSAAAPGAGSGFSGGLGRLGSPPAGGFGSGFSRQSSEGLLKSPARSAPFGAAALPAFGSAGVLERPSQERPGDTAAAVGGSLFGSLFAASAAASVFDGAAAAGPFGAAAAAAAAGGGFGGSGPGGSGGGSVQGSPAAVFGIGALKEEEQRTKRRRSSSGAAVAAAAAAAASGMGRTGSGSMRMSASPAAAGAVVGTAAGAGAGAAASGGGGASGREPLAKQARTDGAAAAAAGASSGGGASGGSGRSFMRQPSLLAASPAAGRAGRAGASGGAGDCCFDPVDQHRSWCPWVHRTAVASATADSRGAAAAAAAGVQTAAAGGDGVGGGLAPALSVGWSSTLLAVSEQLEEQELQLDGTRQQQDGTAAAAAAAGQLGELPKPGQFETTAAVLARARQMLDVLDQ